MEASGINLHLSDMEMVIKKQRLRVRLGNCGRVLCEPGWHMGPSWSSLLTDYDLWFVWQGRGRMLTSEGEFDLRPGSLYWMRPGRYYQASQDSSARLGVTYLHFRLESIGGRAQSRAWTPPFERMHISQWNVLDGVLSRILLRSRQQSTAPLAETWLATVLTDLIHEHEEESGSVGKNGVDRHHREVIEQIMESIRLNPGAASSIAQMSREAGYSADHFSRVFFQVSGERPQAFVIRHKIERACTLLLETSMSIGMVADALGFRDIFYFSRQFRAHMGLAPLAYRRSA
jgi:AraC-like DNA-binding protein